MNENTQEKNISQQDVTNPESTPSHTLQKRGPVKNLLRWTGLSLAGIAGLASVSLGGGLLFLRSDPGERWLTSVINDSLTALPSGLSGKIRSFTGPLPSAVVLNDIVLKDKKGEWLKADAAQLRISWGELPKAFVISEIALEKPVLLRVPELDQAPPAVEETTPTGQSPQTLVRELGDFLKNWPSWLPELRLDELALRSMSVNKQVMPYPFTMSASASATVGREGIRTSLGFVREDGTTQADAPNRRANLTATLTPELELALKAKLSDLGFAAQVLPAAFAKSPAFLLSLDGQAPVLDWKTQISSVLYDAGIAIVPAEDNTILSLNGHAETLFSGETPSVHASIMLDSGTQSRTLWMLAGQKDGRLSVKLDSSAAFGKELEASTKLDIALSDMAWGSDLLQKLLGKAATAGTAFTVRQDSERMQVALEKLFASADHIKVENSGTLSLAHNGDLKSPASLVDFKGGFNLIDAADLSPELAGDISGAFRISGPFSALSAHADVKGSSLKLAENTLENIDVQLDLPAMDVPSFLADSSASSSNASPDLLGSLRAKLLANTQPVQLASDWKLFAKQDGIDFSMDSLHLNIAENSVRGNLTANLPSATTSPAKGTFADRLGTKLPALDGTLSIDIRNWESIAALSKIALSGQPMNASLRLQNSGTQSMKLTALLPMLAVTQSAETFQISDTSISLDATDMWGKLHASVDASIGKLDGKGLSVSPASAKVDGGLDALSAEIQSSGSIDSDIKAQWKPGSFHLERLSALLSPSVLGGTDGEPVGFSLHAPATIMYSTESAEIPALSAQLHPAGSLELSGLWSPEKMYTAFSLLGVELEKYRHIVPDLPAGNVAVDADFAGSLSAPKGNFKLYLKEIKIPGASLPAMDAELAGTLDKKGKQRALNVQMVMPEQTLQALGLNSFAMNANVPFTSPATGTSLPDMEAPLNAHLQIDGQLEGIWKLVPAADQRMTGAITLDAAVEGSAAAPIVSAHVALANGSFTDIMQGIELKNINLQADADRFDITRKRAKDKITLALSASDGRKGSLAIAGWVDPATMRLDIDGKLDTLSPLHRQDIKILLNGTLSVEGTVQSPAITADIAVDKGEVQLTKLPGGSIPTLEITTTDVTRTEEAAPAVPGSLDVRLRIPNQFFVRGYGLDSEWQGGLRVRGALDRPAVSGKLQAVRGSLDILGKNFKLAEGQINFDGGWPVSPLLNIDMEYVASGITANILVGGTASDPKLTLSSQPELPQDEILSQIMFGQSSGSLSHVQALQLASGAASLAGFGGGSMMDLGRDLLGVDVFKVNSDNDGKDSDVSRTSLEMGTYVRDNIYVGVEQGVGRESDTGAIVEIELLPSLDAKVRASGNDTEIGLEWKKNY